MIVVSSQVRRQAFGDPDYGLQALIQRWTKFVIAASSLLFGERYLDRRTLG